MSSAQGEKRRKLGDRLWQRQVTRAAAQSTKAIASNAATKARRQAKGRASVVETPEAKLKKKALETKTAVGIQAMHKDWLQQIEEGKSLSDGERELSFKEMLQKSRAIELSIVEVIASDPGLREQYSTPPAAEDKASPVAALYELLSKTLSCNWSEALRLAFGLRQHEHARAALASEQDWIRKMLSDAVLNAMFRINSPRWDPVKWLARVAPGGMEVASATGASSSSSSASSSGGKVAAPGPASTKKADARPATDSDLQIAVELQVQEFAATSAEVPKGTARARTPSSPVGAGAGTTEGTQAAKPASSQPGGPDVARVEELRGRLEAHRAAGDAAPFEQVAPVFQELRSLDAEGRIGFSLLGKTRIGMELNRPWWRNPARGRAGEAAAELVQRWRARVKAAQEAKKGASGGAVGPSTA